MKRSWPLLALVLWPSTAHASITVCIDVEVKSWVRDAPKAPKVSDAPKVSEAPQPTPAPAPTAPPEKPVVDPLRDFYGPATEAARKADAPAPAKSVHELDPAAYLERLIEYEVTHAEGFVATRQICAQRMVVELYPLSSGWTVFARYTGTGREEKVDHVELDEF